MGGAVSSGEDNDDLIDKLRNTAEYIQSKPVESAFRCVDRADYVTTAQRHRAYKDTAFRDGHVHLSAPCIYACVVESLELEPGLSFLNIGSGTGYLSTICGLLLGPNGVNHGVELYEDNIEYANEKLSNFTANSASFYMHDFCKPKFFAGNGLLLRPGTRLYDRIYCGACLSAGHDEVPISKLRALLKPGGILICPCNNWLMKFTLVDYYSTPESWQKQKLLNVSFARLQHISDEELAADALHFGPVLYPTASPMRLCELARVTVLRQVREVAEGQVNKWLTPTVCDTPVFTDTEERNQRLYEQITLMDRNRFNERNPDEEVPNRYHSSDNPDTEQSEPNDTQLDLSQKTEGNISRSTDQVSTQNVDNVLLPNVVEAGADNVDEPEEISAAEFINQMAAAASFLGPDAEGGHIGTNTSSSDEADVSSSENDTEDDGDVPIVDNDSPPGIAFYPVEGTNASTLRMEVLQRRFSRRDGHRRKRRIPHAPRKGALYRRAMYDLITHLDIPPGIAHFLNHGFPAPAPLHHTTPADTNVDQGRSVVPRKRTHLSDPQPSHETDVTTDSDSDSGGDETPTGGEDRMIPV